MKDPEMERVQRLKEHTDCQHDGGRQQEAGVQIQPEKEASF